MEKHTVTLKRGKETKNTFRYDEVEVAGKPPVLGNVYIPKWVAGDAEEIEVTVGPVNKAKK